MALRALALWLSFPPAAVLSFPESGDGDKKQGEDEKEMEEEDRKKKAEEALKLEDALLIDEADKVSLFFYLSLFTENT